MSGKIKMESFPPSLFSREQPRQKSRTAPASDQTPVWSNPHWIPQSDSRAIESIYVPQVRSQWALTRLKGVRDQLSIRPPSKYVGNRLWSDSAELNLILPKDFPILTGCIFLQVIAARFVYDSWKRVDLHEASSQWSRLFNTFWTGPSLIRTGHVSNFERRMNRSTLKWVWSEVILVWEWNSFCFIKSTFFSYTPSNRSECGKICIDLK